MTVSLTITIDRTSLALSPLVLSGSEDENELGVTDYRPPGLLARLGAMPDSDDIDGTEYISASWQQAILGFNWCLDKADDEADVQAAYYEVVAALGQFAFTVTTQVSGAPAEVWDANRGSISLAGGSRTHIDLKVRRPIYSVTIPVYPIAGA